VVCGRRPRRPGAANVRIATAVKGDVGDALGVLTASTSNRRSNSSSPSTAARHARGRWDDHDVQVVDQIGGEELADGRGPPPMRTSSHRQPPGDLQGSGRSGVDEVEGRSASMWSDGLG